MNKDELISAPVRTASSHFSKNLKCLYDNTEQIWGLICH